MFRIEGYSLPLTASIFDITIIAITSIHFRHYNLNMLRLNGGTTRTYMITISQIITPKEEYNLTWFQYVCHYAELDEDPHSRKG